MTEQERELVEISWKNCLRTNLYTFLHVDGELMNTVYPSAMLKEFGVSKLAAMMAPKWN